MDQLLLWRQEHSHSASTQMKGKETVWIKEGNDWVDTKVRWTFVSRALANGSHGVEKPFNGLTAYINSRRPELTPDNLLQMLKWAAEKIGSKRILLTTPVWIKDTSADGEVKWRNSMITFNTFAVLLYRPEVKELFGGVSFTQFKRKHGYAGGKDDSILATAPAFQSAAEGDTPKIPKITLPDRLSDSDMIRLSDWHIEKEGFEPEDNSATPVWIKNDDGSWAHANTTWAGLCAPVKADIAQRRAELAMRIA